MTTIPSATYIFLVAKKEKERVEPLDYYATYQEACYALLRDYAKLPLTRELHEKCLQQGGYICGDTTYVVQARIFHEKITMTFDEGCMDTKDSYDEFVRIAKSKEYDTDLYDVAFNPKWLSMVKPSLYPLISLTEAVKLDNALKLYDYKLHFDTTVKTFGFIHKALL